MRIARERTNRTKSAITTRTIRPAISNLLVGNERGSALDLEHLDARALVVHVVLVVRPRGPLLATDLAPAPVRVGALEQERARPDRRCRAGANGRRCMQVAPGDRPDERQRSQRPDDEHDELEGESPSRRRDERRREGGDRNSAQEEAERGDLAGREHRGEDEPKDPVGHDWILRVPYGLRQRACYVLDKLLRALTPGAQAHVALGHVIAAPARAALRGRARAAEAGGLGDAARRGE